MRPKIRASELTRRVDAKREEILKSEGETPIGQRLYMRQVGAYSQTKLDLIAKYLYAYSMVLSKYFRRFWYLETCSGPGVCSIRGSGRIVLGTPMLAMTNEPRFTGYRFIEISRKSYKALRDRRGRYCPEVDFESVRCDCNSCIGEVLKALPPRDPVFIVMDPQGLELKWNDVVVPAASAEHSELLINFPYYMGIRRCLSPNQNEATSRSVTEYFGSDAWMEWRDRCFEKEISQEELRDALLKMYVDGLVGLGLPHVQVSPLVTGDKNQPLYHLIFASRKDVGKRIIADIMNIDTTSQTTLPLS